MRGVKLLVLFLFVLFFVTNCEPRTETGVFNTVLDLTMVDDTLRFNLSLVNVSQEEIRLEFSSSRKYDIVVENEEGVEIFRLSDNRAFSPVLSYVELKPGERILFADSWDFNDKRGQRVLPGKYTARAEILTKLPGEKVLLDTNELVASRRFELVRRHTEIEGLVLISDLDPSIVIDLKYSTADNFVGRPVYPAPVAAIKKETGERLVQANRIFQKKGYTIKVWDAYRPLHVQRIFWEAFPDLRFVARPPEGPVTRYWPRHNNGMSVDITLVDDDGRELEMPTEFDNFTERASASYPHMSLEARKNVNYLIEVMESVGFRNYPREWWHFDDIVGTPTPYLDVPLEAFLEFELVLLN